jgi:hypothetical protein
VAVRWRPLSVYFSPFFRDITSVAMRRVARHLGERNKASCASEIGLGASADKISSHNDVPEECRSIDDRLSPNLCSPNALTEQFTGRLNGRWS